MKKIFAILAAALLIVSCTSDNGGDDQIPSGTNYYKGVMSVVFQGEPVNTPDVVANFIYDSKAGTANILLCEVKFVPQMPVTLDVMVSGVTVTASAGGLTLQADGIVPTVGDVPYPQYTVSNLTGTVRNGTLQFSLNFGSFPTVYTGSKTE